MCDVCKTFGSCGFYDVGIETDSVVLCMDPLLKYCYIMVIPRNIDFNAEMLDCLLFQEDFLLFQE